MKNPTVHVILSVLLVAGGAVLWTQGGDAAGRAEAARSLVTLRYDRAADAASTGAAARYWRGEYDTVDAAADPLLAANAAYRAAVAPGGSARELVTRLDDVVKRYAEVLRSDPGNEDAAFNYEFVVRYRAAIAARGVPVPPAARDDTVTPHGRAGGPPKGTSQQQFKVLVPMRPEERREAEEAGKAGRRPRKG
jgi:hypothetical protein